jgi:glycogen debranching enzyme
VYGRNAKARQEAAAWLEPCLKHLRETGLGHLPELFDGDAPHRAGGAIASALSTAELLRCYVEDILGREPAGNINNNKDARRVADIVFDPKGAAPLPAR